MTSSAPEKWDKGRDRALSARADMTFTIMTRYVPLRLALYGEPSLLLGPWVMRQEFYPEFPWGQS